MLPSSDSKGRLMHGLKSWGTHTDCVHNSVCGTGDDVHHDRGLQHRLTERVDEFIVPEDKSDQKHVSIF